MKIYIASDHGGFKTKQYLVKNLAKKGYKIEDVGPFDYDPTDDFPTTILPALKKLLKDYETTKEKLNNRDIRAILICKNGVGVSIFANRFKGIRAGLSWNSEHAKSHRNDDNTNVLALPACYVSKRKALRISLAWLKAEFSDEPRHKKRIQQIEELL